MGVFLQNNNKLLLKHKGQAGVLQIYVCALS